MFLIKFTKDKVQQQLKYFQHLYSGYNVMEKQENLALNDQKKSSRLLAILTDTNFAAHVCTFPENWKLIQRFGSRSGDVPGCDRTPRMGTRGNKLRQDKKKEVGLGFWVLG